MRQDENRPSSIGRWIGVGGVLIVLVCAGMIYLGMANSAPEINPPPVTLPSPNAYDFYVRAGKAVVDREKIGYAIDDKPRKNPTAIDRVYSLAEKDSLVKRNATALRTLRQGFDYDFRNPPIRSFSTGFPEFGKSRNVARLLVLEGQTKSARGDWGGAIDSDLDAVRMGQDMPRGGVLISMLVGVALEAIGRTGAWKTVPHLNAGDSASAAHKLEWIMAREVPMSETFQEEKWSVACTYADLTRKQGWRGWQDIYGGGGADPWENVRNTVTFVTANKRKSIRLYMQYMDQLAAIIDHSYASRPSGPPVPDDLLCQYMCGVFPNFAFSQDRCRVQNALLMLTLAIRAYRLDHGRYPNSLDELAPTYLEKIPSDGFAKSGKFCYNRTGDKYTLYSVGPDGRDDRGKPIEDPHMSISTDEIRHYMIQPNSRGDIVAGVNRW